ncbi:MAG: hypothetical protein HYV29_04925 [Ignavibacteriales bacterium]|nr:hypothetical protein [Ignavibacteriales bacterium]
MLNKNLVYQAQHDQVRADDRSESSKVIEKIYGSQVFQEFMKQWGDASIRFDYKKSNDAEQKQA